MCCMFSFRPTYELGNKLNCSHLETHIKKKPLIQNQNATSRIFHFYASFETLINILSKSKLKRNAAE